MLPWGSIPLVEHIVLLLSTVVEPVRVIGRGEFLDRVPARGPLGGILTALDTTDRDRNLFLAVDLPLLTPEFLQMFHARFLASSKPLIACRISGEFPLCLGIRKELAADVERRITSGRLAVRDFVQESDADLFEEEELARYGFHRAMFANINTPQDWERITKRP